MKFYRHLVGFYDRHKSGIIFPLLLTVALLTLAVIEEKVMKTTIYLSVVSCSFLLSELIFFRGKLSYKNWHIKNSKQELGVVFFVVLVASVLLVYWFLLIDPNSVSQVAMITAFVLRVLFIFPVFFLIYFLGIKKYKAREIGIWGFEYWFVSSPVILFIGVCSYFLFPEAMQFEQHLRTDGIIGLIVLGFLSAAIPEEIMRTLFQSRLGRALNSKSIAWFTVSLIWALQHIPTFAFSSDADYYGATISALGILPFGLLWGYLNERYKSIIPSVILHGTNLWGLHNIF